MLFADTKTFDHLFKLYYSELVAFATKILGSTDTSEDIVQDLFAYLYEKNDQIKIEGVEIKPYLFKAIYNRCMSRKRKIVIIEKFENEIRDEDSAEFRDLLEESEFERHVYDEIQKLPSRCRDIFILNRFDGFSNDEIAEKLNISKRTVETQISNALKTLRTKLEPKTFLTFFF